MKILLDENCSHLKSILCDKGWEVVGVRDVIDRKAGKNSISDEEIVKYALENKRIIVTKDRGVKIRCFNMSLPCIDLGSPEQEARVIERRLREMQAWKEYL